MLFTKSRKHLGIEPGVKGKEGRHTVKNISENERWVIRQQKKKGVGWSGHQIWKLLTEIEVLTVFCASTSYLSFQNSWVFQGNSEGTSDLLENQKHWESGWRFADILYQKELANQSLTGDCVFKSQSGWKSREWLMFLSWNVWTKRFN